MEPKWLEWAKELQAIAQAGLTYSKDVYDLERFERIRELSTEIVSMHTDVPQTTIKDLFANETGYATPKADVRAVIFKEDKYSDTAGVMAAKRMMRSAGITYRKYSEGKKPVHIDV